MKYVDNYYFDKETLCFYLADKKTKYKDLYLLHINDEKTKIENNSYFITIGIYIYQLDSPDDVIFILPDGTKKEIFICYYKHIKNVLIEYTSHDFFYCKDNSEKYVKFNIAEVKKIYPVKKIKISIKLYPEIYDFHAKVINNYKELNPNNLSLAYMKYLKYSSNIQDNSNFFHFTEQRKNFFDYLDIELKKDDVFLPICGPEGIGKTSSILAYCRVKIRRDYFYYNLKTFSDLLNANNDDEIKKLLIEELSHCLLSTELNNIIEKIIKFKTDNCASMQFLINILDNIEIPAVLIIDQYNTDFDDKYHCLKEIIKKYKSSTNIIMLSSLNGDDVKMSVIKGVKKEKISNTNFFLDYLYIGKLAYVSDNDINKLSKQEKDVLQLFGNLYSIFYEINLKKGIKVYFINQISLRK